MKAKQPKINNMTAIRIDDVGAATKKNLIYGEFNINFLGYAFSLPINFLFTKRLRPFKQWGPYPELTADLWYSTIDLLKKYNSKVTIGVTACWVEDQGKLVPFPEKYPLQAKAIRKGVSEGVFEVANHGLTHCVLQANLWKPRRFSNNLKYHREFWKWVPEKLHREHIRMSQDILQNFLGSSVVTFIPPGNVCTKKTLEIAKENGLKYASYKTESRIEREMVFIGNKDLYFIGHDKDLSDEGISWLEKLLILAKESNKDLVSIKEMAEAWVKNDLDGLSKKSAKKSN